MKTKQLLAAFFCLATMLIFSVCRADDITAVAIGNWSDTNTWSSQTVPGINDDVDVPSGITVTVDTNEIIQYIYDSGTITMAPNSTLTVTMDSSISSGTTLLATAPGSTVMYTCNPYNTKICDYNNLILNNTNWVPPTSPFLAPWENFNNFNNSSVTVATPMTIYGDILRCRKPMLPACRSTSTAI